MTNPAAGTSHAAPVQKARRVPAPRIWPINASDVYALLGGNALVILAMWIRHGGLNELDTPAGIVTVMGEIAALYGTYLVLIQLVLMSRSPWLDQVFGQDRIIAAHRWVGFGAIWLLLCHFIFTTVGYGMADGSGPINELLTLLTTYPYVLWSAIGLALFVVVGITSVRAVRRMASYETWYVIHLYTYIAIALSFMHQLVVGADFAADRVAQIYWIGLYAAAFGLLAVFRFGQPVAVSWRHRLRVANVVQEGPGIVSIYLTGKDLDRLPVRAGQWFRLRLMTSNGWWRAHPFSISAAPNGRYLRFTIKNLGDYTRMLQRVHVGTPVFVEGPYGVFTGASRTRARVLFIAGGIGITPLRALLEELPAARGNLTLVYRASGENEVVFKNELDELASLRGATVHYLIGRRGSREMPSDPLDPRALRRLVPDLGERDIYVCGPAGMMERVLSGLHWLRIPETQIHYERFAF
ncbi:MAG: ferredoxin reductase family protein [Candidatus Limnocylindrales bacterium]|jgi:predicted ferric reductase